MLMHLRHTLSFRILRTLNYGYFPSHFAEFYHAFAFAITSFLMFLKQPKDIYSNYFIKVILLSDGCRVRFYSTG